jgi:transcriptional regulator with XRE-family HTH domain
MTIDSVNWKDSPVFQALEEDPQLGSSIRAWRKCQDITQEQLAKQLGISKQLLSRYERGEALPSLKKTLEMASLLDAPVEVWLDHRLTDEVKSLGLPVTVHLTWNKSA